MIYQTTNTRCLIEAVKKLNLKYDVLDKNGNLARITVGGKPIFFANYATPFNSDSFCKITKDKEFTSILLRDVVRMPKTVGVFDPNYDEGGEIKANQETKGESLNSEKGLSFSFTEEICKQFTFPFIIKPNSLSRGMNFSICNNKDEVLIALKKVFEKNQNYNYLALGQEYIKPKNEYRVIIFKNQIMLVYTVKKEIKDETIKKELEEFTRPIFKVLEVGFAGLDIIEDDKGQKYLLEINAEPGFANFVENNGEEHIVEMYQKILKHEA